MRTRFLISMLVLFFVASCTKNDRHIQDETLSTESLGESPVSEIDDQLLPPDDGGEEGKKYVEKACTVGNRLGTLCEAAKGSCKKQRDCTAETAFSARLTDQQIEGAAEDHAIRMVREGYIDPKDMESSRRVARAIITRLQKD